MRSPEVHLYVVREEGRLVGERNFQGSVYVAVGRYGVYRIMDESQVFGIERNLV